MTINDTDAIGLALDLIQRNLSTGIGKALYVQHLKTLIDGDNVIALPEQSTDIPVMRRERLPGMLAKDLAYRNWYHRHVKGQNLCVEILGVQLGPADHISPNQEKKLWTYYQQNPPYRGFQGLSLEDQLINLENKILSAKPKALRQNAETWRNKLIELRTNLPEASPRIERLLDQFQEKEESKEI